MARLVGAVVGATLGQQITRTYVDDVFVSFSDLHGATAQAAKGAGRLRDGSARLADGLHDSVDGADDLADGLDRLRTGASGLAAGSADLADGARTSAAGAATLADGLHGSTTTPPRCRSRRRGWRAASGRWPTTATS